MATLLFNKLFNMSVDIPKQMNIPVIFIGIHKKSKRKLWMFTQDWTYQTFKITKGFITDGVSVPKLFWNVINPNGKLFIAAIIHDWLYTTHQTTRLHADLILYRLARKWKVNIILSAICFLSVAFLGGLMSWDKQGPTLGDAQKLAYFK